MSLHRFPSGGPVPPTEALREGDSTAAADPRVIPAGTPVTPRGPLRRVADRLLVVLFGTLVVLTGVAIGIGVAVVGLALFVAWLTLHTLWVVRVPLIGLGLALAIATIAGWV